MTAIVHKCIGNPTYICKTANGKTVKRHLNQIHKILGKSEEATVNEKSVETPKRDHVYKRLTNQIKNNNEIVIENRVDEIPEIVNTNTNTNTNATSSSEPNVEPQNDELHLDILLTIHLDLRER